jgi:hypothetical protein
MPGSVVLVRALFDTYPDGRPFDRDVLVADASYNFELFGYYGLSLWQVSDSWPLDRVLAEKCRRASRVATFEARDLQGGGLGLVPSGRAPHYDASLGPVYGQLFASVRVAAPTAEELVDRFLSAAYTLRDNEFHDQGQD